MKTTLLDTFGRFYWLRYRKLAIIEATLLDCSMQMQRQLVQDNDLIWC